MSHAKEISSIDFASIIGGPLVAVVDAQAKSAITTVNFIREVGFKKAERQQGDPEDLPETGEPIYVSFKYPKEISPYEPATEDTPERAAVFQEMKLEVPLLCIVPIPYLRVEEVEIDFNVKINSMYQSENTTTRGVNTETSGSFKVGFLKWGVSANFKCTTSSQSTNKTTGKVERTYSLGVKVRAVQDEMPGGMEKILGILEDAIKSQPTSAPAPRVT